MKRVEYSQLVKRKLLNLKMYIIEKYGEKKAKEIMTSITDRVDLLGVYGKLKLSQMVN